MSRLPVHSAESAPEASRPLIEKVQANNGFVPNLIGVLAGSPQALETYLGVGATNGKSSLNLAEREVVQLTAARIHGCGFCVAGHTATVVKGKVFGHDDVLALQYGEALSDAKLQALADFTKEVIATRGAVADAKLRLFLEAGYSERQALDVVLGVSLATLCNFANNLARSDINSELQRFAIGALGDRPTLSTPRAQDEELDVWLSDEAESLDQSSAQTDLLGSLAARGLTRIGVPEELGGSGGSAAEVVESIASLAQDSLAASFVLWGHRCYTEFVIKSDNQSLRERELPALLGGVWAGATGMSNAMKFVCGIESLEIVATPVDEYPDQQLHWRIDGALPWVTNLRAGGFSVAAAAQTSTPGPVPVFAFRSTQPGVERSANLSLIGLRGSDVAAVRLENVLAGPEDLLHADLEAWLPHIRPQFLGFQCGMSIGLARASIAAAREQAGRRPNLQPKIDGLEQILQADASSLLNGLENGRFAEDPGALFRLRIALARHVSDALSLELQAWGGRAYLEHQAPGFTRRWREAAFIPVMTPSLAQLELQLDLLASRRGPADNKPIS